MKVITTTHYNRPEYTRRCLEHLSRCRGIEHYLVLPVVDKGDDETRALIEEIDFCESTPCFQNRRVGCDRNIYEALERGFQVSDYVIQVEDDVLLAPDALRFFEWAQSNEQDQGLFTITAYHRTLQPEDPFACQRVCWFIPWGWATWRSRWTEIRECWDFNAWDGSLNHRTRGSRATLLPLLSRAQNIGAEKGAHVPSVDFHRAHHHTPYWATELQEGEFYELGRTVQEIPL
jgi:hypothetical protein